MVEVNVICAEIDFSCILCRRNIDTPVRCALEPLLQEVK
jgi:hypothetical protein